MFTPSGEKKMTSEQSPSEQSPAKQSPIVPEESLEIQFVTAGLTSPCLHCEIKMKAIGLGIMSVEHLPNGNTIEFSCIAFNDPFFAGEFALIRRDADVPQLTIAALREVLQKNFNTIIFGVKPKPTQDNDKSDDSDDSDD